MKNKFLGIVALRGIAIISVAILHLSTAFLDYSDIYSRGEIESNPLRQIFLLGYKGVYVFFGISAFLIVNSLIKSDKDSNPSHDFLGRRLRRVYPPYIISLVILSFVHVLMNKYSSGEIIYSFGLSALFLHDLVTNDWSIINPVNWSLEVEMQFYIFVFFIIWMRDNLKENSKFIAIGVTFFVFLLCIYVFGYRNLLQYSPMFISGALSAFVAKSIRGRIRKGIFWDFIFISSLFLCYFIDDHVFLSMMLFICIISSELVLKLTKFFSCRPLVFVSKISYSYYLIHYPMFHLLMLLFSNFFNSGFFI